MSALYDEFGNYIGPEDGESSSDDESSQGGGGSPAAAVMEEVAADEMDADDENRMRAEGGAVTDIVLHEEKRYYPDADEVYPDAHVNVQFHDAQDITEPLIKPVETHRYALESSKPLALTCSLNHLSTLMSLPSLVRNVALVGHLHHGKTVLMDLLINSTVDESSRVETGKTAFRCTDTRKDEQDRGISIKACPHSLPIEDSRGKTYVVNVADCPGHVNFSDEVTMSLHACDGVILVVDVVEGLTTSTKRMIEHVVSQDLAVTLCISKMDRLIHELRLPPNDAYYKIVNVIDSVNACIQSSSAGPKPPKKLSPRSGNVVFASAQDGWCFGLAGFARMYVDKHRLANVDPSEFAKRLWGDLYFDPDARTFKKEPSPSAPSRHRSFVQFVLEPIYKMYAHILGEDEKKLRAALKKVKVRLTDQELRMDPLPLLRLALSKFFCSEGTTGLVDMVVAHVPAPNGAHLRARLQKRQAHLLHGPTDGAARQAALACDPQGPLLAVVCKMFATADAKSFLAFARVFSGTLRVGDKVRVLGESYSSSDREDSTEGVVAGLSLCQARHSIALSGASAGNWVLIAGLGDAITNFATVVAATPDKNKAKSNGQQQEGEMLFRRSRYLTESVIKLAIEPLKPAELPKVLYGLQCVSKSYPLLQTKVEESGEHLILGTGELYLDCVMHDLREKFANAEVKVADPSVTLRETVVETSLLSTYSETPNRKNRVTMIAEPLEKGLGEAIETNRVDISWDPSRLSSFLSSEFDWDKLASRSLWAFGPAPQNGANVLLNDTLPSEVDQSLLGSVRDSIVQGFRWATREGPLCEEPIRNVKFRVLDASLADQAVHRGAGFVIPTARRVAYSAFLTATPRVMEPVMMVEVQAPKELQTVVQGVLRRRRGQIVKDEPVPGTPFTIFHAHIPAIESFGVETDVRRLSGGQAFCLSTFDHWSVVPGDPLNSQVVLRPLEPARRNELAREFMVKTRRRKGLPEDVSIEKYFDSQELLRTFYAKRDGQDEESSDSDSEMDVSSIPGLRA